MAPSRLGHHDHTAEMRRIKEKNRCDVALGLPLRDDLGPSAKDLRQKSRRNCRRKVKEFLRSAAARTVDALIDAMGDALRSVTPGDILGWFKHCGYRYKQE